MEGRPVSEPTYAQPPAPWLLAGADLAAILDDHRLLDALARGEAPDPTDRLGWVLAAFVREIQDGGAR
jgi:hypothetical protein